MVKPVEFLEVLEVQHPWTMLSLPHGLCLPRFSAHGCSVDRVACEMVQSLVPQDRYSSAYHELWLTCEWPHRVLKPDLFREMNRKLQAISLGLVCLQVSVKRNTVCVCKSAGILIGRVWWAWLPRERCMLLTMSNGIKQTVRKNLPCPGTFGSIRCQWEEGKRGLEGEVSGSM